MERLAFLISNAGSGTNLQAVIDAIKEKKLNAEIAVVVSDTFDAHGLTRAKESNIPTYVLQEGDDLKKLLTEKYFVNYVCLAGWKKIIPPSFIDAFENKILNIHPGLIPDTKDGVVKNPDGTEALWNKGKFTEKAIQNFLDTNSTYAGSSIHFLTHDFDFGPVLARGFIKIEDDDTVGSLYAKLKEKEHELYVEALQKLCNS